MRETAADLDRRAFSPARRLSLVASGAALRPYRSFQRFIPSAEAEGMGANWHGGFFCPCHGSKFDLSGRVYSGVPAPRNMSVPPYRFLTESRILIGEGEGSA